MKSRICRVEKEIWVPSGQVEVYDIRKLGWAQCRIRESKEDHAPEKSLMMAWPRRSREPFALKMAQHKNDRDSAQAFSDMLEELLMGVRFHITSM